MTRDEMSRHMDEHERLQALEHRCFELECQLHNQGIAASAQRRALDEAADEKRLFLTAVRETQKVVSRPSANWFHKVQQILEEARRALEGK